MADFLISHTRHRHGYRECWIALPLTKLGEDIRRWAPLACVSNSIVGLEIYLIRMKVTYEFDAGVYSQLELPLTAKVEF